MTYNFDPDRWFENQRQVLEQALGRGEIDQTAFETALEDLEARLERMTERLDRPFGLDEAASRR